MSTMNVRCAVSSCANTLKKTGSGLKYYRFPTEEGIRSVWTVRCDRRDSWNPSVSYICSSHFTDDDYIKLRHPPFTRKLHPDAVPSRNLRLYGWDMDEDAHGTGTGTDMSDAEDSFIQFMIKTSSRRKAASPRASHSRQWVAHEPSAYGETGHSETELSGAEGSGVGVCRKREVVPSESGHPKKRKRVKEIYCSVLTCRAKRTKDFHYFPRNKEMHRKWLDALYHGEPHHRTGGKRTKCICRRHFTEDDYLDPPSSGAARRLARGAVPSVNIPLCRAEVRLARLKLHLDLFRRKAEERNLSFSQRLTREPELYDLYREYQDEMKNIDPARAHILPALPANGELVGPGNPEPGDPSFITKKELKKVTLKREQEEKKVSRQELRKEKRRIRNERKREYYHRKKELRKLLHSDPLAYNNLLAEDEKEQKQAKREHGIAHRIAKKANAGTEIKFGDTMAIVGEGPDNGAKYKVIVKKVMKNTRGGTMEDDVTVERVLDTTRGAELFRKVISKVDVSSAKRIKFTTTDKITKMGKKPLQTKEPQELPQGEGDHVSKPAGQVIQSSSPIDDGTVAQPEPDNYIIYQDDHHNYDDDDDHRSDNEMGTEDIPITEEIGGPDHCYTNKIGVQEVEIPTVDPFVELQEQLRSMPEEEARMVVKEKMDGYRAVFKQQVSKLRQLLRARQKSDRKVRCLTRILCTTLREQITKYYLQ